MAITNMTSQTLVDLAKLPGADGTTSVDIVEVLSQVDDILMDIRFMPTNKYDSHQYSVRTGLPSVGWTSAGQPTKASKSHSAMAKETCAQLKGLSTVNVEEANLGNNDPVRIRAMEDKAHLQAMEQAFAYNLIYGNNKVDPRRFTGLAPRFNDLTGDTGSQIIDADGASTDNTSMWLVGWGDQSVFGIVPNGMSAGLQMHDDGIVHLYDPDTQGHTEVYKTRFVWNVGLAVKDWRYVARVANISVGALTKDASSGADLIDLALQAKNKMHTLAGVSPAWYVNRTIYGFLERQVVNNTNVRYDKDGAGASAGYPVLTLAGVPVRRVDSIHNNESLVA